MILKILLVTAMTALHEAGVILYTRGIARNRVWVVMIITGFLALFGFMATEVMIQDDDMKWPMTVGHMLGVPLGFLIPLDERSTGSETASPKVVRGFRSSDPS